MLLQACPTYGALVAYKVLTVPQQAGDASTAQLYSLIQDDTKKRELLKNPTKIEEIQEKKFIDRN